MDYRKTIAAAALAFVVAASPAVFANDALALFERADLNRDGVVTRAEADAIARSTRANSTMKRLDRNGDSAISRSEWDGDPRLFVRLDRNRDGVLSRLDTHLRQRVRHRFHGLDRNRDGIVTRTEWNGNSRSFRPEGHQPRRHALGHGAAIRSAAVPAAGGAPSRRPPDRVETQAVRRDSRVIAVVAGVVARRTTGERLARRVPSDPEAPLRDVVMALW